jgi:predicted RNase H-like HicB family nuclease
MAVQTFLAVIHKEDDLYVADCPEFGTVSQGYSVEEAFANLQEATELYLEGVLLPDIGQNGAESAQRISIHSSLWICTISDTLTQ